MTQKEEIRYHIKTLRSSLDSSFLKNISSLIVKNIESWDIYCCAKNIMLYYPVKNEISLLKLLENSSKNFYFPLIKGDDIFPVIYNANNAFQNGQYNIPVPSGKYLTDFSIIDLVLTPALAVSLEGYRIGYGKGYYDRFFEKHTTAIKAVPVYSKYVIEDIQHDIWDKPTDYVITENSIFKTTATQILSDQVCQDLEHRRKDI